jgi:RHS repeat-associated protein
MNELDSVGTLFGGERIENDQITAANNAIQIPQIQLPKAGGAIKGIDEKFHINGANGTASFSIPFPLSHGRSNSTPALSLSYNSGSGSSPFGLGWDVHIPFIQRKTDRELPRYRDADESDVFLLSGTEDLVPCLKSDGNLDILKLPGFTIQRYRPRIEGSFARIEKILPKNALSFYWKITTKDNEVSFFGRNAAFQIADPSNASRIFKWLPEISFDDKGNLIAYEFKKEDGKIGEVSLADKNRFSKTNTPLFTQQYLKRINYGNTTAFYPAYVADPGNENSIYDPALPAGMKYFFALVIDYGEHGNAIPGNGNLPISYEATQPWLLRTDPFSDYRAGFDIRTYRLCKRVLQFHLFDELGNTPCLVRSLDLEHNNDTPGTIQKTEVNYLQAVQLCGYARQADGTYNRRRLPKMEFDYQPLNWNINIQAIAKEDIVHAPAGLSQGYHWVDLYSEGMSGILTEQGGSWYYKSNEGSGHFTEARPVTPRPSFNGLANGILSIQDLDADGTKQIVSRNANAPGFFEINDDNEWMPFHPFKQLPITHVNTAGTRFVDLTGDGKADILTLEEDTAAWHPSKGKTGYGALESAEKMHDEDGPCTLTSNHRQKIFMADMSGDGLADIVRVGNGEICYWPNLGYGKFGARVCMENAPLFDSTDLFDTDHLQVADITGTGATDILYLGKNKFRAWINLSGNSWSTAYEINPFPSTEPPNNLSVVDLLGNGTGCIVWTSSLPQHAGSPMKYIDLMSGKKPHIMTGYRNNMGRQTIIHYASSTLFYLADKKAGRPWVTKLPFPVQCVAKTEVIDTVTDLRFVSRYTYHHGYYDHQDREFRGFGLVEQTDTEEYEFLKNAGASNATAIEYHEPPVLMKTWFHTGAYLRNNKILDHFKKDHWYNDPAIRSKFGDLSKQEPSLPDAQLTAGLTPGELAEAYRACKGMVLREEVFTLDKSEKEKIPFTVITHNCNISLLQPANTNRHAVFLTHQSESITYSYERNPDTPSITHTMNLAIDNMGNVTKAAAIAYPRQKRPVDMTDNKIWEQQNKRHIMVTELDLTKDIITPVAYRTRLACEVRTYELQIAKLLAINEIFRLDDLKVEATDIAYEKEFTPGANEKKLIEHRKNSYLRNDLLTAMPHGNHDSLGFTNESYQLAFTPAMLDFIYKKPGETSKISLPMISAGGYIDPDGTGNWWIRSGTVKYIDTTTGETANTAASRFYLPQSYSNALGTKTRVSYYKNYHLLVQKIQDALDNETIVEAFDLRNLSPVRVRDNNNNVSAIAIDTLGLVVGTAIMGKGNEGDDLIGLSTDLSVTQINDFFANPFALGASLLQHATTRLVYDLTKIPFTTAIIVREQHHAVNPASRLQYIFKYADGSGNAILQKIQAEPGEAPHRDAGGILVKKPDGTLDLQMTTHRWSGNGRTIFNNKGKPVKQYEPYFSDSHLFEQEPELRETGVTVILHYDAAGRVIKTIYPDDTFSSSVYDSWMRKNFDLNDNCKQSKWYQQRINNSIDALLTAQGKDPAKEKEAAEKAAIHDTTPFVTHLDSLGSPFYFISHNKFADFDTNSTVEEFLTTQIVRDTEGNLRSVIDARKNIVSSFRYDMLGRKLYQNTMDGAERWTFPDCLSKTMAAWDSKDHRFETRYDLLQRPLEMIFIPAGGANTVVFEKFEYPDRKNLSPAQLNSFQLLNLMGQCHTHYDSAGIVKTIRCDFKGNTLENSRQLCKDPKMIPDWKIPATVQMETEVFVSATEIDALNRSIRIITPHTPTIPASVIIHTYNEANFLETVKTQLRGSVQSTDFITNIEYDARGNRSAIFYANNTVTKYTYDLNTGRLIRLVTTRQGGEVMQDLNYTYDPSGNITYMKDKVLQTVFFNNQRVDPDGDYVFDSLYRLIQAKGREHIANNQVPNSYDDKRIKLAHKGDGNQLQRYTQRYKYDAAGNILLMKNVNSWSRNFTYATNSNQLLTAMANDQITPFNYQYDIHGNMKAMPHLPVMEWNFKDQLQRIGITASDANEFSVEAFYTYASTGQRMRKLVEKNIITEERIYLGGFEIFRKRNNGVLETERETLHIMDGSGRVVLIDTKISADHVAEAPLIRYQYSNHLGTAALELDGTPAANIISYEEYYPYGSTSYQATDQLREVPAKRYRYTGKERDEESGLSYHGARYYASWLTRWTSCDPAGLKGGTNTYVYCRNAPTGLIDSNGAEPFDPQEGHWFRKWLLYGNDTPVRDFVTNDRNLSYLQAYYAFIAVTAGTIATGGLLGEFAIGLGATATEAGIISGFGSGIWGAYAGAGMEGRWASTEEVLKGGLFGGVIGGGMAIIESKVFPALLSKATAPTNVPTTATPNPVEPATPKPAATTASPPAAAPAPEPAPAAPAPEPAPAPVAEAPTPEPTVADPPAAADPPPAAPQDRFNKPVPKAKRIERIKNQHGDRIRVNADNGRPETFIGEMKPGQEGGTSPSGTAQERVRVQTGQMVDIYDAGHMRPSDLGGKGGLKNTWNQLAHINRGAFRVFEQRLAQLVESAGAADQIFYAIHFHYSSPSSTVPESVKVFVRLNGQTISATFSNSMSMVSEIGKVTFTPAFN